MFSLKNTDLETGLSGCHEPQRWKNFYIRVEKLVVVAETRTMPTSLLNFSEELFE